MSQSEHASVRNLEQIQETDVGGTPRGVTILLVALGAGCIVFAALALVLATVGLYGVIGYLVARRTKEIGIRMALGAQKKDVVSMVLTQGIRPTLAGILFGLGGAYLASRALASMLYNVEPLDAATLVAVSGLLLGTAVVATLAPARRASRIAPASTLRME